MFHISVPVLPFPVENSTAYDRLYLFSNVTMVLAIIWEKSNTLDGVGFSFA